MKKYEPLTLLQLRKKLIPFLSLIVLLGCSSPSKKKYTL